MSIENLMPIEEVNGINGIFMEHLQIPPYLHKLIGIDVDKTGSLMKWGNIGLFGVNTLEDEPDNQTHIIGHDEQGNAYGGFSKTKNPEMQNLESIDLFGNLPKNYKKEIVLMSLNIQGISNEITAENKNLRDTHEWARRLNAPIRNGLMKKGVEVNLGFSTNPLDWLFEANNVNFLLGLYTLKGEYPENSAVYFGIWGILELMHNYLGHNRKDLLRVSYPLRASITAVKANTTHKTLIKPLKAE